MFNMMSDYFILQSSNASYKAIVVSLSSNSLSDNFKYIANSLSSKKISGKVLLDYYLSNNDVAKRFFEIDFDGSRFLLNSFKKTKVPSEIKKYIDSFYQNNRLFLQNNVVFSQK